MKVFTKESNHIHKKVLIINSILPFEMRRLYGLVGKEELIFESNDSFLVKKRDSIIKFYNDKKNDLNNFSENNKYLEMIKGLQKRFGDDILVVNQEVDNHFELHKIKHENIHGDLFKNNENDLPDILYKGQTGKYDKVIDLINQSHYLIFVGSVGQLEPRLFIEEMTDSLYVNIEDEMFNGEPVSKMFQEKIIDDWNNVASLIEEKVIDYMEDMILIDEKNPYKDDGKDVIETINKYMDEVVHGKHKIPKDVYNRRNIKNIHLNFPFTKKISNVYLDSIWQTFCYETQRKDNDYTYTPFFYDMLLIYSFYRWKELRKILDKTPKISLTNAYNKNSVKEINIFRNLIIKKMGSLDKTTVDIDLSAKK